MSEDTTALPVELKPFFWDYDFSSLSWESDRSLIVMRLLTAGDWDSILWLRRRMGDRALRAWILEHEGRGLDAPRLRFWELILDLPHDKVDAWVDAVERSVWGRRGRP